MKKPYVCVIGGSNVDITCTTFTKIKTKDSNPGVTSLSCGGVSRNIAENLARLGLNVVLITVLGTDFNAHMIEQNALSVGIDLSHSLVVDEPSSCYVSVNDVDNDMFVGVASMGILDKLTPEFLAKNLDVINGAQCVVTDTNIPNCLDFLIDNVNVPIFLDTVSAKKTVIANDIIKNLHCIKPNEYEAEILSGIEVKDEKSALAACKVIAQRNIDTIFVSCGEKGSYCYNNGNFTHVPFYKTDVKNTTGAGDSFMSGIVYGFAKGMSAESSAAFAAACATITVSSIDTVCKELSAEKAFEIVNKNGVK